MLNEDGVTGQVPMDYWRFTWMQITEKESGEKIEHNTADLYERYITATENRQLQKTLHVTLGVL